MQTLMELITSGLSNEFSKIYGMGINIVIIKAVDKWIAPILGNFVRNLFKSRFLKALILMVLFVGMIYGAKTYSLSDKPENLYQKYSITRRSTSYEIRDVYRKLARSTHPDLARTRGTKDFTRLNEELKLLINDQSRWTYDRFGQFSPKGDYEDEVSRLIVRIIELLFGYLVECNILLFFAVDEPNIKTKHGGLILCVMLLLLDIYYLTAKNAASQDPLSFFYPELTLYERSNHIRQYFLMFYFMLSTWKYALSEPWGLRFRTVTSNTNKVLELLKEADSPQNRPEWERQQKQLQNIFQDIATVMRMRVTKAEQPVSKTRADASPSHAEHRSRNSYVPDYRRATMNQSEIDINQGRIDVKTYSRTAFETNPRDESAPRSRAEFKDRSRSQPRSGAVTPRRNGGEYPSGQEEQVEVQQGGNSIINLVVVVAKSLGGILVFNLALNFLLKD